MRNFRLFAGAAVLSAWAVGAAALDLSSVDEQAAFAAVAADDCYEKPGAKLEIGGAANVAVYSRWTEAVQNVSGSRREYKSTAFEADVAALLLKVTATENNWLTVKLDLDDAWNNAYDQDDFLEEMYFTFNNIACSGFGVKVGKMEVPFGYDKDTLLVHPYLHALRETNFTKRVNGANDYTDGTGYSPLSGAYAEHHSVEYDNLFAITPYWSICDGKLLLEASLFQAKRDVNGHRRSNDDMFFKSGSLRATWRPIENLMIQASVITRYNDRSRDALSATADVARRMYATSVAADYSFDLFCRKMNVFAEWQHSWNTATDSHHLAGNPYVFYDDSSSDDVHFGLGYQLTDRFKLHMQGEWLKMRADKTIYGTAADADSSLWRALVALETKLPGGIVMESGIQHEWLKLHNAAANALPRSRYEATTYYSGLKFSF